MDKPKTIHDFNGFPQALFDVHYPAPGAPALAQAIEPLHRSGRRVHSTRRWGLDHGAWGVLKPMFPQADIPVVQLSLDYSRGRLRHYDLASSSSPCATRRAGGGQRQHRAQPAPVPHARPEQAYDWAHRFDEKVAEHIATGHHEAPARLRDAGLGRAAGASRRRSTTCRCCTRLAPSTQGALRFFNANFQAASISMRSAILGGRGLSSRT